MWCKKFPQTLTEFTYIWICSKWRESAKHYLESPTISHSSRSHRYMYKNIPIYVCVCHSTIAPQHRNTAAPQHHSTRAPEHRSTTTLQHQSIRAPEHQSTRAPEHQSTTAPQHHSTAAPQHHRAAATQHHSTTAPQHRSTAAPQHKSTTAPQHYSTTAPQHHSAIAPQRGNAAEPQHRSATAPQRHRTTACVSICICICICICHRPINKGFTGGGAQNSSKNYLLSQHTFSQIFISFHRFHWLCVWSLCVWSNKQLSEFETKETCAGLHMCDNMCKYIIFF